MVDKNPSGMIGLEIHSYISTKKKLFCDCNASREKGLKPNTNICPICTGAPGAKPMLPNKSAVEKAIQIAFVLGCKLNEDVFWQRKHYDWPDLPKGYQNTFSGSSAETFAENGKFNGININGIHLEEDPASWDPKTGEVDYNRSGLPLVEIITAPDFTKADEVIEWLGKLIHSLNYLKSIDTDAGIKVDVNVSIPGKTERVEIKNINSLESISKAINYELKRQREEGGNIRETRRFDEAKEKTFKMRDKESGEDYRFIIDPDLQPLNIDKKTISDLKDKMPENPEEKLKKMIKKYKIDEKNSLILTKNIDIVEFFEKVADKINPGFALPWVTIELLRVLNYNDKTLSEVDIKPEHFIALLNLVKSGKITELQAKQTLNKFYPKSFMPENMEGKITDEKELEKIAWEVMQRNEKAVSDYKSGETNALNFLLGDIMKATQKRADFAVARKVLQKLLK